MTYRELVLKYAADMKEGEQGLDQFNRKADTVARDIENRYNTLASRMSRAGVRMSVGITTPLTFIGRAGIQAAMDAGEIQNKFEVAFKGAAGQAEAWADQFSKAVGGLNKVELKERAAQFQLLFNAMDMGSAEATKMSTALTQLAYDFASLYNTSNEEAFQRLTSGMMGETEAIRRFGIDISDAALKQEAMRRGISKSTDQMSQAEKVMLRYDMIMRQSKDAQGDLIRTQDSAANKQRLMSEAYAQASVRLGRDLIPTYMEFITLARKLANAFAAAPKPIRYTVEALAGIAYIAGPVLGAGASIAQMLAAHRIKQIALTTAKTADTVATEANTAAEARNFVAKLKAMDATAGAAAAHRASAGAIAAETVAARGLLATLGLYTVVAAAVAAAAWMVTKTWQEGTKALEARRKAAQAARDAEASSKYAEEYIARGDHSIRRQTERQVAATRAAQNAASNAAAAAASDAQRKAREKLLAQNQEENRKALQEKYILSQTNEHEREIAEARVDYVNRLNEIAAKVKEARDKYHVILDVQAQVNAATAAYENKVAEANRALAEEKQQAHQEAAAKQREKVAEAWDTWIEDTTGRAMADAIRRGDELGKADVQAAEAFMRSYADYTQGKLTAGGMGRALAEFNAQVAENRKRAQEEQKRAQEQKETAVWSDQMAAYERAALAAEGRGEKVAAVMMRAFASYRTKMKEIEDTEAKTGVQLINRREAAWLEYQRTVQEANEAEVAAEAEKTKRMRELVLERVKSFKQEAEERINSVREANRAMLESMKAAVGWTSAEEIWRKAMASGARERFRAEVPYQTTPAMGATPTDAEIEAAVKALREDTARQNDIMAAIERNTRNLKPSYVGVQ